jgi:hypothetical protein
MAKPRKFKFFVCKPCWELKYCPYGLLVEQFPLNPGKQDIADVKARYDKMLQDVACGAFKSEKEILCAVGFIEHHWPPRWDEMLQYDTSELECNVFGHICPAFFTAESSTETVEQRRSGRHIPRHIMFKVVRRDGQICQVCYRNVPDNELEFDHVIPYSKGGPTTVENLRVLCQECNAHKHDSFGDFLSNPFAPGDD